MLPTEDPTLAAHHSELFPRFGEDIVVDVRQIAGEFAIGPVEGGIFTFRRELRHPSPDFQFRVVPEKRGRSGRPEQRELTRQIRRVQKATSARAEEKDEKDHGKGIVIMSSLFIDCVSSTELFSCRVYCMPLEFWVAK